MHPLKTTPKHTHTHSTPNNKQHHVQPTGTPHHVRRRPHPTKRLAQRRRPFLSRRQCQLSPRPAARPLRPVLFASSRCHVRRRGPHRQWKELAAADAVPHAGHHRGAHHVGWRGHCVDWVGRAPAPASSYPSGPGAVQWDPAVR